MVKGPGMVILIGRSVLTRRNATSLAADLAVGDDVDAGALLVADREQRGVVLRLLEPGRLDAPQLARAGTWRDDLRQAPAVDQPVGLRVAAHQRRGQQGVRETFRHWRPMRFSAGWLHTILSRKSGDAGTAPVRCGPDATA
jgi:hypothetical protein